MPCPKQPIIPCAKTVSYIVPILPSFQPPNHLSHSASLGSMAAANTLGTSPTAHNNNDASSLQHHDHHHLHHQQDPASPVLELRFPTHHAEVGCHDAKTGGSPRRPRRWFAQMFTGEPLLTPRLTSKCLSL